mgnify:CR=1 FL=1
MKRSLDQRSPVKKQLWLSFLLPFVIACISFAVAGLFPVGDKPIMASDGWHQYYPFLVSFREKLRSGGSLQYTWDVGMGNTYLSLFAYYLSSPLYLLSALVPLKFLREFYALATVLKISLAGLFFGHFLRIAFRKFDWASPLFALCYAMCAWACGYYWNIIWLDTFALLPLLIAGMVSLLRDGKFRLYTITLALSLWCSYYIAYFCCIFVLLCFIGYCILQPNGFVGFLRRFTRIGICTLIGIAIAAVLLVPTLLAMQGTYSSEGKFPELLALNMVEGAYGTIGADQTVWSVLTGQTLPGLLTAARKVLANLLPAGTVTSMDGLPNVFCGFATVLLAVSFCCNGKIRLREKLFSLALLLVFLLSYTCRVRDYIWHGFHFPNMLPYRFSFLSCFVLICMAYRAYTQLGGLKKWTLAVIGLIGAGLLVNGWFTLEEALRPVLVGGVILLAALVCFAVASPARSRQKLAGVGLSVILLCEMTLSFALGVAKVGVSGRTGYPQNNADVQQLLTFMRENDSELFYRTEVTQTQTLNDGALNGYHGVTVFNSSTNVNFNRFSGSLGLASWPGSNRYAYYENTPFANTMLGLKYLLDRTGSQHDASYNELVLRTGEVSLLRNKAYVALGFMTDGALADFVAASGSTKPLQEQAELFRLATGLDEPLYTYLGATNLEAPDGCTLTVEGSELDLYRYSTANGGESNEFHVNYEIPTDGVYAFSLYRPETKTRKVKVYRNDELVQTLDISARTVFCLGDLKAGDALSLRFDIASGKGTTFRLEFARQNDAALDTGIELLRDEPLILTAFSDTRIRGTIAVKQDGLLYTSIPYEKGWTAYVDGKAVEMAATYDPKAENVKLSDAVIAIPLTAGMHDIELRFTAPGLKTGALISLGGLLVFALLLLLRRKRGFTLLPDPPTAEQTTERDGEEFVLEEHLDALGIFDPDADYTEATDDLPDLSAYLKGTEWEEPDAEEAAENEEATEAADEEPSEAEEMPDDAAPEATPDAPAGDAPEDEAPPASE